jgi:CubicO group peptidase (beta-lactamase class C family)
MPALVRRFSLLFFIMLAILLSLVGCGTYAGRLITLRTIDVEDYRLLPARAIGPAAEATPLPVELDRGWITRMPLAVQDGRLTTEAELDRFLAARGTTAFLVLHDGRLVDERYYHGYGRDSLFKSFSISKSVLSALVGIAQSEGVLSLSEQVGAYVPLPRNPAVAAVTFEQLADNVSDFRYRRGNAPWKEQPRMYYTTDVRRFLERLRVVRTPGTTFEAEELSPLLLGYALEQALRKKDRGMTLSRYA